MIIGYFDERGRPYVQGDIDLPTLGAGGQLSFLLDTGSDKTCLMPRDGRRLGVDYSRITSWPGTASGIGGAVRTARRVSWVYFTETAGAVRCYRLQLDLLPDIPELAGVPSLLGQDILSRWRTIHEPARGQLHARVNSADFTLRI